MILVNTMSAFVGTKLDEDIKTGAFLPATEKENLEEERELLAGLLFLGTAPAGLGEAGRDPSRRKAADAG